MPLRFRDWRLSAAHQSVVGRAVRAAVAAVLAWLAVIPMGGLADDYPYYAPLGAVIAVATTVSDSLRSAVQALLAVLAGGGLAVALHATALPMPVGIGLVVALGTVVGAHRWFGTMGGWVAVSALFILILGRDEPWHLGLGYLALTALGALVGSIVSVAVPPLHLAEAARTQDLLRDALVDQLDELAGGLESEEPPTVEQWRARRRAMEPKAREVKSLIAAVTGRRINWRLERWRPRAEQLSAQGSVLVNLAFQIGVLADLIGDRESPNRAHLLGPELRPPAAAALRSTADALRTVEGSAAAPGALADALRAVHALADAIRERRDLTGEDHFAAGTLVDSLRSELLSVKPTSTPRSRSETHASWPMTRWSRCVASTSVGASPSARNSLTALTPVSTPEAAVPPNFGSSCLAFFARSSNDVPASPNSSHTVKTGNGKQL